MADALTFMGNINFAKGRASWVKNISNISMVQTSVIRSSGGQTVGSSAHEALEMGMVTLPGRCFMRNCSDDYPLQVGIVVAATFYPVMVVAAGDDLPLIGRFYSSETIYVKGVGGDVDVDFCVFQEDV